METILLVTASRKSADMLLSLIQADGWRPERILVAGSCNEARRLLIENHVDLILINTPLSDEFGHDFAIYACQNTLSGVLMLVKSELSDSVSERVEQDGVFVVTKPIFFNAIQTASETRLFVMATTVLFISYSISFSVILTFPLSLYRIVFFSK